MRRREYRQWERQFGTPPGTYWPTGCMLATVFVAGALIWGLIWALLRWLIYG